jgi:SAM-dependent methyltransferase
MDGVLRQDPKDMGWEGMWAPYDEGTYRAALEYIYPGDVVLDIGAGDLRFARRAAKIAQRVYAMELRATLLRQAAAEGLLPENLVILQGDAREIPFPAGITCGVLLMRHCIHFKLYASKLKHLGAERLVTNARWGFGIEAVVLQSARSPYEEVELGWYACWCGAVGFKSGDIEKLTPEVEASVFEVVDCPECKLQ